MQAPGRCAGRRVPTSTLPCHTVAWRPGKPTHLRTALLSSCRWRALAVMIACQAAKVVPAIPELWRCSTWCRAWRRRALSATTMRQCTSTRCCRLCTSRARRLPTSSRRHLRGQTTLYAFTSKPQRVPICMECSPWTIVPAYRSQSRSFCRFTKPIRSLSTRRTAQVTAGAACGLCPGQTCLQAVHKEPA